MALVKPSQYAPTPPARSAGGDDSVPRDAKGRPRIWVKCWTCDGQGGIPSEKRPGKINKCSGCGNNEEGMKGWRLKSYTRTTTYIDVLEDKTNINAWQGRMTLIGTAIDPTLLDGVLDIDPETREGKDALNRRAEIAKKKAGAEDKADRGSWLHGLSEMVDNGEHLPEGISIEDIQDMWAYRDESKGFKNKHIERLVVNDELCIGGTPDRVSWWVGDDVLVAPNGVTIEPTDLLITDLKTGTVEYGTLKMAMQLAIYSRSKLYYPKDGRREEIENLRTDWGIIMHLPAGSGEMDLYWADLNLGWEAVQVATRVRDMRRREKAALIPVA